MATIEGSKGVDFPASAQLDSSQVKSEPQRVASISTDDIAQILLDQPPPSYRAMGEALLRARVGAYLDNLKTRLDNNEINDRDVIAILGRLDNWLYKRLSGKSVLMLIREFESSWPQWIAYMPRTVSARYEQIRLARIWSALLDPHALGTLARAIEQEMQEPSIDDIELP